MIRTLVVSFSLSFAAQAGEWVSLFDGESLKGWTNGSGKAVEEGGWVAEDGVLYRKDKGGSLFSEKEYGDFEFRFQWKISEKGNSGVKYRVTRYEKGGLLGPEFQVLDDDKHPDGKVGPNRQSASLYDILAADSEKKKLKVVGEWNTSRIVARGGHFQHFLNGQKVIEITVGSDQWKELIAKSKFKNRKGFAENPKGRLMLQDHSDPVWYRKLEVRELKPKK
ncbi:MAG: 3-keto-disaccharide hydrolase [Akkermansiaceae bacterium]